MSTEITPATTTTPIIEPEYQMRFGIPSLDELISGNPKKPGIDYSKAKYKGMPEGADGEQEGSDVTSVCIIGPDGTGKSVLTLHLVSHYAADCYSKHNATPRILYVSTDLRYEKARRVWLNFMLDNPLQRPVPFYDQTQLDQFVELKECVPGTPQNQQQISLRDYLSPSFDFEGKPVIAFINLASYTAGDDWGYLNRALATMNGRNHNTPCDLIVLDAVEGLETLVGEQDAYGETRSRRARIAQFIRAAGEKCHVALVVEEEQEHIRQPEEYVTDVVIRLRTVTVRDKRRAYVRRTVDIEKARAQTHARGQHQFTIRGGKGSTTGTAPNPDDYEIKNPLDPARTVSYIHVFHSLDHLNRQIMETRGEKIDGSCDEQFAGFGIDHLDEMLAFLPDGKGGKKSVFDSDKDADDEGLPCSSTTALIGETGTHKNRLANAFLSQCFVEGREHQIGVLITTRDMDADGLAEKIKRHIDPKRSTPLDLIDINKRVICRRLEVHDISSAVLFHIIQEAIWEARMRLAMSHGADEITARQCRHDDTKSRHAKGRYIRLVISDLALMSSTYADVKDDSGFLPALLFYLEREGVTSLLVHTEEGGPNSPQISDFTRALRNGVRHHLYAWHVPFFGEDRICIAPQPPISDNNPSVVRELRCQENKNGTKDDELLEVDPHFEMYTGLLEKQTPRLVPLQVRLWGGPGPFQKYQEDSNRLFKELFHDMRVQDDIVMATPKEEYEDLLSINNLQGDTRLESTIVMQVDSFWTQEYSSLLRMENYLRAKTVNGKKQPVRTNDPYRLFQLTERTGSFTKAKERWEFFNTVGYNYAEAWPNNYVVDRVPYTWDFGFLLLRESVWRRAFNKQFKCNYPLTTTITEYNSQDGKLIKVGEIWNRLTHAVEKKERAFLRDDGKEYEDVVSWREFLHACTVVARSQGAEDSGYPHPFDIDMLAPETFSCLVLEVWASEIYRNNRDKGNVFKMLRHEGAGEGLITLIHHYKKELYRAWLLLGEVFSPTQFGSDGLYLKARSFYSDAVAARHWYSTASHAQEERDVNDPLFPVRLPGHYSVRGDWFLAIARGSRSPRLGERAIDLLSSRRANVVRMQEGIGLPTRDFIDQAQGNYVWTKMHTISEYGDKEPITYGKLKGIGSRLDYASDGTVIERDVEIGPPKPVVPDDAFYWLWRYTLKGYDRQARMFLKMHSRILFRWRKWMELDKDKADWRSGFEAYDKLDSTKNYNDYASYREFDKECDRWIEGLKSSTLKEWLPPV